MYEIIGGKHEKSATGVWSVQNEGTFSRTCMGCYQKSLQGMELEERQGLTQ